MKKMAILIVATLLTVSSLVTPVAAAPSDSVIKTNCCSSQSVLSQLEKVDAALRINRGRVYNEIMDLLYAMNSRLAANKISATALVSMTSEFEEELTNFRSSYNSYDDKVDELISFKCQNNPAEFYSKLVKLREARSDLNDYVKRIDKLASSYQTEFNLSVRPLTDAK